MTRESVLRALQRLDRQLQGLVQQRHTLEAQRDELQEALRMVKESSGRVYKIIANLLVERSREDLVREVEESLTRVEHRIKLLTMQEEKIMREMEALQKSLQGGGDGSPGRSDEHS